MIEAGIAMWALPCVARYTPAAMTTAAPTAAATAITLPVLHRRPILTGDGGRHPLSDSKNAARVEDGSRDGPGAVEAGAAKGCVRPANGSGAKHCQQDVGVA